MKGKRDRGTPRAAFAAGILTALLLALLPAVHAFAAATGAAGAPASPAAPVVAGDGPPVVLLHGLLRSSASMHKLERSLEEAGFRVCNVSYPSRQHPIEVLAASYVAPAIERCFPGNVQPIAFVTHSLGGIVVRQLATSESALEVGRVVMLAPPNHGSELVDRFGSWWIFRELNGPAGSELGTAPDSLPNRLGPPAFELGVLMGTRTTNLLMSAFLPSGNDGKVSIASARLDGMKDFLLIPVSHTFIMRSRVAIEQTIRFLREGKFDHQPQVATRPLLASLWPRLATP